MIEAYKKFWTNYFNFKGLATRSDYWWVFLVNFIINFILGMIGIDILTTIYSLATLIPSMSLLVRRLHDINKSGWNVLAIFVLLFFGVILMSAGITTSLLGGIGASPSVVSSIVTIIGFAMVIVGVVLELVYTCRASVIEGNRYRAE